MNADRGFRPKLMPDLWAVCACVVFPLLALPVKPVKLGSLLWLVCEVRVKPMLLAEDLSG